MTKIQILQRETDRLKKDLTIKQERLDNALCEHEQLKKDRAELVDALKKAQCLIPECDVAEVDDAGDVFPPFISQVAWHRKAANLLKKY